MKNGDHSKMESVLYQLLVDAYQEKMLRILGVLP